MIIKKRKIAAIAIGVMIVGTNVSAMGSIDAVGKCSEAMNCSDVTKYSSVMNCNEVTKCTSAEVEKALAEMKKKRVVAADSQAAAEVARANAASAIAKAMAEADAARTAAKAAVKDAIEVATEAAVEVSTEATAQVDTKVVIEDSTKATAEVDAAKAAAEAAKAAVEAAKATAETNASTSATKVETEVANTQTDLNKYPNVIATDSGTYVVDPNNGDRITTTFDRENKITNVSIICSRKDAPDTFTATSPSGTDALIVGDGDIFNCDAGYYGNSISQVSLSPEYKSSLKIELKNSSEMTGEINNNNNIQNVVLTLDKTSKWIVKGASYLSALENEDTTLSNIIDNGNTIYYESSDNLNSWLGGKTYKLNGGGELVPLK